VKGRPDGAGSAGCQCSASGMEESHESDSKAFVGRELKKMLAELEKMSVPH